MISVGYDFFFLFWFCRSTGMVAGMNSSTMLCILFRFLLVADFGCGSSPIYTMTYFPLFLLNERNVRTETHLSCWYKLRKEPVVKRRANREELERVSYTLQAAEPP